MSERREAIQLAKRILDDASLDPDSDESVLARQLLRRIEANETLHQLLRDAQSDPYLDLIHANRDEMLKMRDEAIIRVRKHLAMDDVDKAIAVLDALSTFHPMHAESWKGWPE